MKAAALVTGGAKRIGKNIALCLASLGYNIALHYNQSDTEAKKTASLIKKRGVSCEIFPCDLSSEAETCALIPTVKKRFSSLKLLINCASIFEKSQLRTSNIELLNRHFTINFITPYVLSCDFARICKEGQIINLLDANVVHSQTTYSDYLLSKKALAEFTKMAAIEFAPQIRVNAIAPGLILAPKGKTDSYLNRLAQRIPLRKKGDVSHINETVRFFIKNDYITGQTIFVDGGLNLLR